MLVPWRIVAALLVWLATLIGAGWWMHGIGASSVQAKWDRAERLRDEAIADAKREDARIARQAEAEYARTRADRIRRQAEVAHALRNALQRPISCPAGGSMPLADVVVPAAAVDSLRRAGADHAPDRPTSADAGR